MHSDQAAAFHGPCGHAVFGQFEEVPHIYVGSAQGLAILVKLLTNAKHACEDHSTAGQTGEGANQKMGSTVSKSG